MRKKNYFLISRSVKNKLNIFRCYNIDQSWTNQRDYDVGDQYYAVYIISTEFYNFIFDDS